MINICVYEDDYYSKFFPLTFTRPCYDLLLGVDTLFDKINRYFSYGNITLHSRPMLKSFVKSKHPDYIVNEINTGAPCLFINGRTVLTKELYDIFTSNANQYDLLFTYKNQVVAAYLQGKSLEFMKSALQGVPSSETLIRYLRPKCVAKELDSVSVMDSLWSLIHSNDFAIQQDFAFKNQPGIIKGDILPYSSIYNENQVYVGQGTHIEDFVVLNARKGPIYIDEDVTILSGSRLEGPLYIGKGSQILGGKVSRSSIGPVCKISGEVSNSIVLGYSNKAHDGFLGHSYLGEWVNLGAGTTTSNLKNTYTNIKLTFDGESIDTGQLFLGGIFGDYARTAIGSLINSGTRIGYGSVLLGANVHMGEISNFTWGESGKYKMHQIDKFFEIANTMMERRGKSLHIDMKSIITQFYNQQEEDKKEPPQFLRKSV